VKGTRVKDWDLIYTTAPLGCSGSVRGAAELMGMKALGVGFTAWFS